MAHAFFAASARTMDDWTDSLRQENRIMQKRRKPSQHSRVDRSLATTTTSSSPIMSSVLAQKHLRLFDERCQRELTLMVAFARECHREARRNLRNRLCGIERLHLMQVMRFRGGEGIGFHPHRIEHYMHIYDARCREDMNAAVKVMRQGQLQSRESLRVALSHCEARRMLDETSVIDVGCWNTSSRASYAPPVEDKKERIQVLQEILHQMLSQQRDLVDMLGPLAEKVTQIARQQQAEADILTEEGEEEASN